jgi:hypothetical protein
MAAKFFVGLPLDGPDPECVNGHGAELLAGVNRAANPRPADDHSKPAPVTFTRKPVSSSASSAVASAAS